MAYLIESKRIRGEIARKYESDPRGWRLLWGIDKKGRHNFLVAKDSKLWWLKEELINPVLSVGLGISSSLDANLEGRAFGDRVTAPSYGLRPIAEEQMRKIVEDLTTGMAPRIRLQEILHSEPKSLRELNTSFLMQGPLHHVPRFTDILSDKQRELDAKLSLELDRLILKRYPQLMMSYT